MPLIPTFVDFVDSTAIPGAFGGQGMQIRDVCTPRDGILLIPRCLTGGNGLLMSMFTLVFDPDAPDGSQITSLTDTTFIDLPLVSTSTHQAAYTRTWWFAEEMAFVMCATRHRSTGGNNFWVVRGEYDDDGNITITSSQNVVTVNNVGYGQHFVPMNSTVGLGMGIFPDNGGNSVKSVTVDMMSGSSVQNSSINSSSIPGAPAGVGSHFNDNTDIQRLGYVPEDPAWVAYMEVNGTPHYGRIHGDAGGGVTFVEESIGAEPPYWGNSYSINGTILSSSQAEVGPNFTNDGFPSSTQLASVGDISGFPIFAVESNWLGNASADEFDIQVFQSFQDGETFEVLTRILYVSQTLYRRRAYNWLSGEELGAWEYAGALDCRATIRPQYWMTRGGSFQLNLYRDVDYIYVPPETEPPWLRQRQRDDQRVAFTSARNGPRSMQRSIRQGWGKANNYF